MQMKHSKTGQVQIPCCHEGIFKDGIYTINTFTATGRQIVKAYMVDSFPYYDDLPLTSISRKRGAYITEPAAFDIETTSVRVDKPYAFMYHWQFCINGHVIFGRTWEEFDLLVRKLKSAMRLSDKKKLVIYVHNLSYEFQFLKTLFHWDKIFARGRHKILRAETQYLEFRCSYFLSNESLEKFCEHEDTHFRKGKGEILDEQNGIDFKYDIYRTPWYCMSNDELAYCYNDVAGLYQAVMRRLMEDDLISIPMTSTGYVRRDIRALCRKQKNYNKIIQDTKLTKEQYELCKEAFRGGDTHASYNSVGIVWEEIESYDISSSYPYSMMLPRYPMTQFVKVNPAHFEKYYRAGKAMLFRMQIKDFEIKDEFDMPYLPIAKCRNRKNIQADNGRILRGDMAEITVTDIDFKIIKDVYTCGEVNVKDVYIADYDYLPEPVRLGVVDYYAKKTQLKGLTEFEYEYMKSKNKLNSAYGMMVTDIAQDEFVWNGTELVPETPDIEKALTEHYANKNTFLAYQWGIWVTANSRWRLHKARRMCNSETIYNDTDSLKLPKGHAEAIEQFNRGTMEEIESLTIKPYAENKAGKRVYMGVMDYEGTYEKFITWGSKKYAFIKNGKIETTVAGLSKKKGREKLEQDGFEAFAPGWMVPVSGNLTAYYNDDNPHYINLEGRHVLTASNVALFDSPYVLDITGEYSILLKKGIDK